MLSLTQVLQYLVSLKADKNGLEIPNPWKYIHTENYVEKDHLSIVSSFGKVVFQEKDDGTNITTFINKVGPDEYMIIICGRKYMLYVVTVTAKLKWNQFISHFVTNTLFRMVEIVLELFGFTLWNEKEKIFGLEVPDYRRYNIYNLEVNVVKDHLFDLNEKIADIIEVALRIFSVEKKAIVYWSEYRNRKVNHRPYPKEHAEFSKIFDVAEFDSDYNLLIQSTDYYRPLFDDQNIHCVTIIKVDNPDFKNFANSLKYRHSGIDAEGFVIKCNKNLLSLHSGHPKVEQRKSFKVKADFKHKAKRGEERINLLEKTIEDACKNFGYPKSRKDGVCAKIIDRVMNDITDKNSEYSKLQQFKIPRTKEIIHIALQLKRDLE